MIADDTVLLPHIIADGVCQEAARAINDDMPLQYSEYLADRAETIYRNNTHFAKRLRKDDEMARDLLYAFMRHWLAAKLKEESPPAFDRLPPGFCNGEAPPPDMQPAIGSSLAQRFPYMAAELRPIAAEAAALGLAMSNFNSGARRNGDNGMRFFRSPCGAYVDHFTGNHMAHCKTIAEAAAFVAGYKAALALI